MFILRLELFEKSFFFFFFFFFFFVFTIQEVKDFSYSLNSERPFLFRVVVVTVVTIASNRENRKTKNKKQKLYLNEEEETSKYEFIKAKQRAKFVR